MVEVMPVEALVKIQCFYLWRIIMAQMMIAGEGFSVT
jgi:hypothetical protein